jgi:hypothetical protein
MSFISQRYITNAAINLFASYLSESVRPFGVDMGQDFAVYFSDRAPIRKQDQLTIQNLCSKEQQRGN